MKNILAILLLLLILAPSAHANDKIPCYWHKIESDFDSVTYICEEATYHDFPRKSIRPQIEQLYAISSRNPQNKAMKARALYWDAWMQIKRNTHTPDSLLKQAFIYADSAQYPYDYARFRFLEGDIKQFSGEWAEAYRIYKQQEAFSHNKILPSM